MLAAAALLLTLPAAACDPNRRSPAEPDDAGDASIPAIDPSLYLGTQQTSDTQCEVVISTVLGERSATTRSAEPLVSLLIAETPGETSRRYVVGQRSFVIQYSAEQLRLHYGGREADVSTVAAGTAAPSCLEFRLAPDPGPDGEAASPVGAVLASWAARTEHTWTFCEGSGLVRWREHTTIGQRGTRETVATCDRNHDDASR
jgi:hypothetical protein